VEVGSVSKVKISKENIYGWEGYRLSIGDISLGITPQIGGRIISLTFEGEELFFVQKEHQGEIVDLKMVDDLRAKKKELGFRLWGGDKTWVAPQSEWWEKIPPLDLDAGQYDIEVGPTDVVMTSPICRETGLQIIRRVELKEDGTIMLDQTFSNTGNKPIERGIWDVTQMMRPFEVYLPGSKENFRAYKDEGLIEDVQTKIEEHEGCMKISCNDATHFKFGGFINQGSIVAVRRSEFEEIKFVRTFKIDADANYAHQAMVEVYNSPQYPYCEIEVHAPLVRLEKGEHVSHRQEWNVFRRLKQTDESKLTKEQWIEIVHNSSACD